MAAVNIKPVIIPIQGASTSSMLGNLSITVEKNKQWQRELLMERIRSHSSQHKTFQELSKGMRMGMLEKRYPLDAVEKSNLQKCLDNMQHCIKVTSRQGLVERLESLSRQLSLKFSDDSKALFISTDMFYLEILLDSNGSLTDVKVHHESKVEQQSCSELVDCLNRGDFTDFTAQLEGFSSIYQLNAESKIKIKAYDAMLAMETDLYRIFQIDSFAKDTLNALQESIVGIVLKRRGGHPMRLVYFISPYDLISLENKTLQTLTLDTFKNKQIGFSVTVNLEASSANKLQIKPTVTSTQDSKTGLDVPIFAPLTQMNSMLLPATFVLRLNKPLPVCYNTLHSMGLCVAASNDANALITSSFDAQHKPPVITNIMSLIIQTASEQLMKTSQKGLFVCLPDQTHCYFFTENKLLQSTLIHSVPFTEPSKVPAILSFLKKMALFYSLLASCVRPQSKMGNDIDSTTILEVNAISFHQISVSLQHPYEESMATVEFDLSSGLPQCSIYSISNNYDVLSIKLTNIIQKCLSIPVTIRALLKFWDQDRMKMFQRNIGGGSTNTGGIGGGPSTSSGDGCSSNMSNMPSTSRAAYGNFNMSGGSNDPGGGCSGGMKMGCNTKMMEATLGSQQQRSQMPAVTAEFLKYKGNELKQEDFHESPKSQPLATLATTESVATSLMQSNLDVNSLGLQQQHPLLTQQQQQHPLQTLEQKIATDHEIADKYKNIWKDKTPNLKNTVSITPINDAGSIPSSTTHTSNSAPSSLDVKRTGGIEIIPLIGQNNNVASGSNVGTNSNNTSTTITITPINSTSSSTSLLSNKDKKSSSNLGVSSTSTSSSSSSNKRSLESSDNQKDKKRKKRRDDSPMGPPEKVFSRQNSPAGSSEAAATAVARKFSSPSSSPKGSSGGLLASTVTGTSLSARPSPKHSPVYSSPKHNTASNSPKSPFGTHSPKHGSSGKPSMSTLKSATAASPKGDKSSSTSNSSASSSVLNAAALVRSLATGSSSASTANTVAAAAAAAAMAALKNKDKSSNLNSSTASSAAAAAAAAVKSSMGVTSMQQLKSSVPVLNHMSAAAVAAGYIGANSSLDLNTAMRKGVAAAVSLMTSTPTTATVSTTSMRSQQSLGSQDQPDKHKQQLPQIQMHGSSDLMKTLSASASSSSAATAQAYDSLNTSGGSGSSSSSEYMVKSSQEGLKLTINKTTNKSTKSSSSTKTSSSSSTSMGISSSTSSSAASASSSSSFNKKLHTGLKPGVSSGPASKKSTSSSSSSSKSSSSSSSSSTKHIFQKSNSSGSLSTKLGNSSTHSSSSSSSSSTGYGLSKSHSTNTFSELRRMSKKSHSASTSPALPTPYSSSSTSASVSTSQPATRLDHHADMMKILQYASPIMAASMEGFMKGLNSKFQIPKLSQRNNNPNSNANTTTTTTNSNPHNASSTSPSLASTSTSATSSSSLNPSFPSTNPKIKDNKSISSQPTTSTSAHQTQSSVSVHILKSPSASSTSTSLSTSSSASSSSSSASSASSSSTSMMKSKSSSSSLDFLNPNKSSNSNATHVDDTLLATLAAGK